MTVTKTISSKQKLGLTKTTRDQLKHSKKVQIKMLFSETRALVYPGKLIYLNLNNVDVRFGIITARIRRETHFVCFWCKPTCFMLSMSMLKPIGLCV